MNKSIHTIIQFLFILLSIAIPTSIAITNLLIAAIILFWFLDGRFKNKIKEFTLLKWPIHLFFLVFFYMLGLLWGDNHNHAAWVFQRLGLILVLPFFVTLPITKKTIRRSVLAFLITLFISSLLAIAINNNIINPISYYFSFISNREINSAFLQYNYHNILLSFGFLLCLYVIIEKQSTNINLFLVFILVYVISIYTELGRAGQVLVFFVSIFYILYYNLKHPIKLTKYLSLFLCSQLFFYNYSSVYKERVDNTVYKVKNKGFKPNNNKLKDIRYVMFDKSINKIKNKPILGHGTGSFKTIYDKEIKRKNFDEEGVLSNVINDDWKYNHMTPHNNYLFIAFELGIIGLYIFLSMFYHKIKELRRHKHGIHKILLPISYMLLMFIDSYFFIFTITASYIYLLTIYIKYKPD